MSRLNLLLIPNFWLTRRHESGPARTGSPETQGARPRTEPAMENERVDGRSESEVEYVRAVEPAADT